MTSEELRVEAKARRLVAEEGYRLIKSRTRDPEAIGYGLFAIIDPDTGGAMNAPLVNRPYSMTVDDVLEWVAA
ncbi:MAG: hypothetical protein ACU0DW_14865 [Shimia sp.]